MTNIYKGMFLDFTIKDFVDIFLVAILLYYFYRLMKDPKRIGRMAKLPLFLVHVAKEKGKK